MSNATIARDALLDLYTSGKSMFQIAQIYKCSPHKIVYWMHKFDIKRRTRSEASYIQQNPYGDPFIIKQNLSPEENFLFGLGLGIYWGEGEKVSKHAVRVANTDPFVIKTFILFLLKICQLEKRKLSYSLICFNNSNPTKVGFYWANQLKTDPNKFGKIVQIPPQGKGIYKRKSQFGVCTVTVSNIKLKSWLMKEINKVSLNAGLAQW